MKAMPHTNSGVGNLQAGNFVVQTMSIDNNSGVGGRHFIEKILFALCRHRSALCL